MLFKKVLKPSINQNLNRPLIKELQDFPGKGVVVDTSFSVMQHSIRLSLSLAGTTALALTSIPFGAARAEDAKVAQGTAKDLGVMSISLKDAIQPNFGFQGALQGAGTPNQAGIGGFLPLVIGDNSVFFLDAQANACLLYTSPSPRD